MVKQFEMYQILGDKVWKDVLTILDNYGCDMAMGIAVLENCKGRLYELAFKDRISKELTAEAKAANDQPREFAEAVPVEE